MSKNNSDTKITIPVVLFDGVCNLCNTSVRFLLAYNRKENLHFAPLQSNFAKEIIKDHKLSTSDISTVILIENNKVYTKSTAALKIAEHLIYPWRALIHFKYFPVKFRDSVYNVIARNRYRWFGKKRSLHDSTT